MHSRHSQEQVLRCPTSNLHVWELTSCCSTCELEFAAHLYKHESTKARLCCNEKSLTRPLYPETPSGGSRRPPPQGAACLLLNLLLSVIWIQNHHNRTSSKKNKRLFVHPNLRPRECCTGSGIEVRMTQTLRGTQNASSKFCSVHFAGTSQRPGVLHEVSRPC